MTLPGQSVAPLVVCDSGRSLPVQNEPCPLGQAPCRHADRSGVANLLDGELHVLGRFSSLSAWASPLPSTMRDAPYLARLLIRFPVRQQLCHSRRPRSLMRSLTYVMNSPAGLISSSISGNTLPFRPTPTSATVSRRFGTKIMKTWSIPRASAH